MIKWHDCCKIQGNCLPCGSIFFREKNKTKNKKTEHFSKYIDIKIEMNLCSGKTAKLKDLFPIERDCGLNAQLYYEFSNFFESIRPTFLFKLIYKPADCNFRKSGKKIKYHSDGYIFIFSAAYSDIHFV